MPRTPGGQVAPEQFYGAAMAILADEGASGLKIRPLCRALGVTSGSFYHHFSGWTGFVGGLLRYWESEQTARVIELTSAGADPLDRIEVLKRLTIALPHAAEAAIRAWGTIDVEVGRAQRRVDEQRRIALEQVLAGVIEDPGVAARLAVLGMSILVGFQQLATTPGTDQLRELLDEYQALVLRHTVER